MSDVDWDLFVRYFGNECTAEERERFESWLAADPHHRVIVDGAVMAARRTLDEMRTSAPPRVLVSHRPRATRPTWMIAAASLMIVAGSALLWKASTWATSETHDTAALHVARTARGGRQQLRLSDGTRVVLGAASTLRYPAAFGGGSRDVYLTGEGFFEVTHDAAHPFRVHAGHTTTEDIGTAFGVLAYADDSIVRVVVAEGSVSFGAAARGAVHGAVLTRGQLGSLAKGDALASVRRVNVDAYLGWTEGRLVFDEAPLTEVVAQLGRWYDASFRIADSSLVSRTLTASFTTESLTDVLTALAPVLDVRFERVADTVVVHRR
jgi:ferric-dicitrate binding protein FerR (iron transport regulator)